MSGWNHQAYATAADPLRQSDLNEIAGSSYSCPKRFEFRKHAEANGVERARRSYANREIGTAVHETISRVLKNDASRHAVLVKGRLPQESKVLQVVEEEFNRAVDIASNGQGVEWGKLRQFDTFKEAVAMVRGALRTLGDRCAEVLLVEAPFTLEFSRGLSKPIHAMGTCDLVYLAHDGEVGLLDWKTGKAKPDRISLDHGYQLALYARAVEEGLFYQSGTIGEGEPVTVGRYPKHIDIVHVRDFTPYKKKTKRKLTVMDAAWAGGEAGKPHEFVAGDERGPGWFPSHRTANDDARFAVSLKTLVGTVRLGRFLEHIGPDCTRCEYRERCLTEGHGPSEQERRALNRALDAIPDDLCGFDEVA